MQERPQHAALLGGRYELGSLLGRGGMSEVYRAQDQMMQREVAVKVLRANGSDDTMARRMSQEARIVAAVDHPHLVRVHDAGCEDGRCYLVMELVDGGTLGDLVARGPVPAQLAARIGAQLAQALGAIHAAGFVHRDIKPANVLLARPADPADVSARLTDFGIARMVDGTRLTSTGLMLGTAPYLSPEQVLGTLVGYPSDVYALGLLLLECRTAAQAYPGPAVESAVARLHRQPDVPADLGPAWVTLLTAMTAREPAHRPTAEHVAASLSELAEGHAPAGDGALLAGPSNAEPVGDSAPASRGSRAGRAYPLPGAAGHSSRGAHATHPSSRTPEEQDAARHPVRGTRRLLGAAAAAAAVFTAAALVSGGSSAFRGERHEASQPAHHRAATTSAATSPSLAKSPGKRAAAAGTAALAGTVAGGSASVEPAARTSANGAGAAGTRGGSISSPTGSGSAPSSAPSSSHSGTNASSGSAPTTGMTGPTGPTGPTGTTGAKGSPSVPGSSHGHGDGKGHGNGNGNGSAIGHGAGHAATSGGPGGTTGASPSSSPTPTTSDPTSSNQPSSSNPSGSPTSSPTSTPGPAVSTSDPNVDPLASSSTTSDSTANDSTTNVAGPAADLLP